MCRKSGAGLCPGMEQGILVDYVCMCVCEGASQRPLSVERIQVAGNRGERKPRQNAHARGPSIGRSLEVQEAVCASSRSPGTGNLPWMAGLF